MNLSSASVWGNASANLSWANKAGPSAGGRTNGSVWDDNPSPLQQQQAQQQRMRQQQQQQQQQQRAQQQQKASARSVREEKRLTELFSPQQQQHQKSDFELWCVKAMSALQTEIDIPVFLGFLNSLENPNEVNTIGERPK